MDCFEDDGGRVYFDALRVVLLLFVQMSRKFLRQAVYNISNL